MVAMKRKTKYTWKVCKNRQIVYSWAIAKNNFGENNMALSAGAVHHITLTVTDPQRSKEFYTSVLGLNHMMDLGEKIIMGNDNLLLVINPPPDRSQAPANDRFTESRCGLDHVSFTVESRAVLEEAVKMFDEKGISHGEINDLSAAGIPIYVLAFRDPDNIQLEFTAPKEG
jgi:catechol 2,3-dioxygenase-like lactoylglutathione lyase family enzyme